ncbi:hypothetical protein EDB81DRAFT_682109 [Dactylonectria macrodidyma]|uniref:Endo-1,3(4)-beta-glucanase n=1 Tax=Dactylonectria macrodidyma TaxID=307937 RepID=A0A9P9JBW6_9HYPO|nr:hypothetical protein EDB81DRAFT_682109 [Dactylonectria macrodidyma]
MAYQLNVSYAGESLLSGFNWINYPDPSNGFVSYQNQEDALRQGLYSIDPDTGVVRIGVDSTNKYTLDQGRPSIRLESKESFDMGLFIADFLHMPPSQCGVWPAFWAYGADWPNGGELDIIEGANLAYTNIISGHTAEGCSLDSADDGFFTGERRNFECGIGTDNVGCGYNPPESDTSSYGDGFNAIGGGVYAVQWNRQYLSVWHFPRGSIPADIKAKQPDPSGWGPPQAIFGGAKCEVDDFFNDMNLVVNINFCGDYGASTWQNFDTCTALADTCVEYVADNPEAFENVYWDVNYIEVYKFPSGGEFTIEEPSIPTSPMTTLSNGTASITTPGPVDATTTTPFSNMTDSRTTENTATGSAATGSTATESDDPASGSTSPTDSPSTANPGRIGDYTYLGCFSSTSRFPTFNLTQESGEMTLERCVNACAGVTYAGVYEGECYCADRLDAGTRALGDGSACDHPCPGDETEFCGGIAGQSNSSARFRFQRRDAPGNYLLSVCGNVKEEQPETPPPMRPPPDSVVTGVHYTRITIPYMIPCPTNMASLMSQQYVASVYDCGCDSQPKVPMETKVVNCEACGPGGENAVTVTVPVTTGSVPIATGGVHIVTAGASNVPSLNPPQRKADNQSISVATLTLTQTPPSDEKDIPLVVSSGSGWIEARNNLALAAVVAVLCAIVL